jgi:DNA modification methylase
VSVWMQIDMSNWQNRLSKEIKLVPANQLLANPMNARRHPVRQREALRGSLDTLGWVAPVFVGKSGYLLDGHARVEEALSKDENTLIPVIEVDLEVHEESLFLASFDYITYLAEYDRDSLDSLLHDVQTDDARLQVMLGELAENNDLFYGDNPPIIEAPEPQIDRAEELNKIWQVKTGDLWIIKSKSGIGEHRLLCGDSTKQEDVSRLFSGRKSQLVVTDPPYGVSIGDKNKFLNSLQPSGRSLENIENDTMSVEDLKAMLTKAFSLTKTFMEDCCAIYLTAPQGGELGMMMMMMMDAGLPIRHVLMWAKNAPTFSMGRLDYDYQHEPILYTWNKKHEFYGAGEHKSSIWFVDKPRASAEHPTMKPVALFANAILNSSLPEMIVHDPFSGSGTTGVACEQHGRQSRLMEYEPRFCAVILQRMKDMGLEPRKE